MRCPNCGKTMVVDFELIEPRMTVYKCPHCGHKETV